MFENICSKEISLKLKEKRIKILKDHFGEDGYKYKNNQRGEANKLFYKDNEYLNEIDSLISKNSDKFSDALLKDVFPKMPYSMYGYNGKKICDLNKLYLKVNEQKLTISRNKGICGGKQRETNKNAKIWYSMYFNDKEKYYFEIRGKNDLYKGSMQLMVYKC